MQDSVFKPLPELTVDDPVERLREFYQKLGWDGESVVDPTKVRLHSDDHVRVYQEAIERARSCCSHLSAQECAVAVGFLWLNKGPSGGGRIPGMVELLPGWCRKEEGGSAR